MNLIDGILLFVKEMKGVGEDSDAKEIQGLLDTYGMTIGERSPEERAKILAFIGLIIMDLALCSEEDDGSYSTATLTARSIVKATEEVLVSLGMKPDFLATCAQSIHHPRVMPTPKAYDDPNIVWN